MLSLLLLLASHIQYGLASETVPTVSTPTGPSCHDYGLKCLTGRGPIHDSTLNITEILWIGPETSGQNAGSPSIVRVPGQKTLLASHDFYQSSKKDNTLNFTIQVFADDTGLGAGAQWRYVGNVSGIYWANLFAFGDSVYLLGVSGGDQSTDRDIVISRSADAGVSWTTPVVLFAHQGERFYHTAPTPTVHAFNGRLYRSFEAYHNNSAAFMIYTTEPTSASTNLLDPTVWAMSSDVVLDIEAMVPLSWGAAPWGWQEGGVVEDHTGRIYNILRIDQQTKSGYNKAAMCQLDPATGTLRFVRMLEFPSCPSKFVVRRWASSDMYFTVSSYVTEANLQRNAIYARNHLVLAASRDLIDWRVCQVLLTDDTGYGAADSARFTGFQYVDWMFDGNDILYVIRTAYRGARSFQDANRLGIKRIVGFRAACGFDGQGSTAAVFDARDQLPRTHLVSS